MELGKEKPKVGLATILINKDNLILLGKRINSHGHDTLCFPGGNLEYFEKLITCGERELYEETGLKNGIDVRYLSENAIALTNDIFKEENKHYITLFMLAKQISNKEPRIMEPQKCSGWSYKNWDEILKLKRDDLFLPIQNLIKQGFNPYNIK